MDLRERYLSFIFDLNDLTDHTFRSGLREEHPMVCRSSKLQFPETYCRVALQSSTMSRSCARPDRRRSHIFILTSRRQEAIPPQRPFIYPCSTLYLFRCLLRHTLPSLRGTRQRHKSAKRQSYDAMSRGDAHLSRSWSSLSYLGCPR
jgi:hypothetical protein